MNKSLLSLILFSACILAVSGQSKTTPKLILQITVDQLRGDMPFIIKDRWVEGGFKYLAKNGVWYANAHHSHANTETIVGHVTLSTGAYPSRHGMVGNVWFDAEKDRLVYNIEDNKYEATGGIAARDMDSEVDPTQVSRTGGRSPHNILTTTFSDELKLFYGDSSKIFAVSGKDRGAVSMAGHVGKAFWYSTKDGAFASSTYYFNKFPGWVNNWNGKRYADQYYGENWGLSYDIDSYRYGAYDDRPYENPEDLGFGRVFPHPFGDKENKYYYTLLLASPVVDELTVDFTKELIKNEGLGKDNIPDYLGVSLSSTDYIGHLFGPSSLETEDNLLRLDKTLADLLNFIDNEIGLNNTLIVLSSDHGAPDETQNMQEKGLSADIFNIDEFDLSSLDIVLKENFGIGKEVIKMTFHPYVYFDKTIIKDKKLDIGAVSRLVAQEYMKFDGIAYAIPSTDLIAGRVPDAPIIRQVMHNYNPKRSGDIYLIYEPHWGVTTHGDAALVNHGSPWRYDTFVPIVFAGHGLNQNVVYNEVYTVDVALTLTKYMGIKDPSGASGQPLIEVLIKE